MKVSEAIQSRISCRAYLDKPVPELVVREILDICRKSPSGGNLQPWIVYALSGDPLQAMLNDIAAKMQNTPRGEGLEYAIYPPDLREPYNARRFKCGEDLYATIKVARGDKPRRLNQFRKNFRLFGAPVGLFFCIDRQLGPPQWADLGMFLQSVMLLSREFGLHTCPQEAWASWHKTVSIHLDLPPHLMLFCGMAMGYMNEQAPINSLRTERESVTDFATFIGF